MTTFRIGPIARTAARLPGGKHAAAVVRSAIKTPYREEPHGSEVPSGEPRLQTASSVGVQLKEGQTMLKSAIRRWRDWRRERHIERQERKINARTALRDYKKTTGHEGGAPGG